MVYIGYISRTHSFKGEIQISLDKKIVSLTRGDFVFIKIEGHFIPYKIENLKGKQDEPVLTLEFITDYDTAYTLVGKEIYADIEEQLEDAEITFIGFDLVDKQLSTIGTIKDIMEMPQQIMLVVDYNDKECYIPLAEDFIDYISLETKEIWVDLPQGILDI